MLVVTFVSFCLLLRIAWRGSLGVRAFEYRHQGPKYTAGVCHPCRCRELCTNQKVRATEIRKLHGAKCRF